MRCQIFENEKFADKMRLHGFYVARNCDVKTKDEDVCLMINSKSQVDILFNIYSIIINFINFSYQKTERRLYQYQLTLIVN